MPLIHTAISTHSKCLVCRRRIVPLHRVKLDSILYAYSTHQIIIKHHARCCGRHLNDERLIINEHFHLIRTRLVTYDNETKRRLDSMIKNRFPIKIGTFEQFNNMRSLTESHCLHVTGWSKDEFLRFSDYIINVKNTKHRKKNEMIALYRYWLRNGMSQSSLALYGNNWKQRDISRYLDKIRNAINQ